MDHCAITKRKRNPREAANIFSLLTFFYTGRLFKKAYVKKDLCEDDLYEVLKACGSKKCGDKLEEQWILENKRDGKPSLYRLMWARYGWRYIFIGVVNLIWKIFNSIVEPWAFSRLISYFKHSPTSITKNEAYLYAALVLALHLVQTFYTHNYMIWVQQLGVEVRTSLSSLLYRKALKLSPGAISEISVGNIVTLITRDVETFQDSIWIISDTWIGIVQTCVICYLLCAKMGAVALIGVALLLSVLPIQVFLGKCISKLRLKAFKETDERLQVTQETLSTIKIIKMYNWEEYFIEKIKAARMTEMKKLVLSYYLSVVMIIMGLLTSRLGFYFLIMSYIWLGYTPEAELIFYVLTLYRDLNHTLGIILPLGLGRAAEVYTSIVRIDKVLNGEELHPEYKRDEASATPLVELKDAAVKIRDAIILKGISLSIKPGVTMVTGTVGSGKSSLLKAILQDYPLSGGHLLTHGRISYASQDPWLFPSSVRQNIIFGKEFDEKRYKEVVRVCALEYDFNQLENGDETIVSDKGANLSKGQQARVNLARAIYKDSEIYLIDDSLTALDAHVQDYIYNECIKGFLKEKICVLVTQTTSHIQDANDVVIMENGEIKYHGRPSDAVVSKIKELVVEDDDLEKEIIEMEEKETIEEKVLETEHTNNIKIYREDHKKGVVDLGVYKKYVIFGGGYALLLFNVFLHGIGQGATSYSDKLLTKWVDQQQKVLDIQRNITDADIFYSNSTSNFNNSALEEAITNEQFTIRLYSGMIFAASFLSFIKIYFIFRFGRTASIKIHRTMVRSLVYGVMSFFDTNFIGNILNRFSQDLQNVDQPLVFNLMHFIRINFVITGIIILISTVNPYFLIFGLICMIILISIRKLYIPTGRSLKRLETATRSPMLGHMNASLDGLTTIRAFKAQGVLINEFDRHQDLFTSAYYTSLCSMRAFGFIMDFVCNIFIIFIVAMFIFFDTGTSAGNVGLALSQVFMLSGSVQWGVRTWAELENLMTSVERLLEYTTIPSEIQGGSAINDWPSDGMITYENVSLKYSETQMVLKNLNFTIEPRQKVGIVGRTGAGKSSIISSIFRLYGIEGRILIDDVDISTLSLKFLRKRLAIIPQDPVFFSGTIRTNLDPFREFQDEELWRVLEEVNIKNVVTDLDMKTDGNGGSGFSSGQKQLVVLARAILRKSKIVILDEATANMDPQTESLLHGTIKKSFSDCTVMTIAHRLHSILECDKVMVLDRGLIKEFDDPTTLLDNRNGYFYKMVKQTGFLNHIAS
ncbi:unnamed protein product [Phaedon cochleariae]|uniref:AAA+ ATPase domain-containing protein n=1 Tax=Phaedon cochleariae TaxID=80249 RepID=A0A9P0E034_PHACE|nr:unnamed protein product [Phaedon cochleariae]